MMMIRKKGQAALEFLTTYGWAFLVILVMIGALAYFGVLRPGDVLPAKCMFSPEVQCMEHQILPNQVQFKIRNNVGVSANFTANLTYLGANNPSSLCTPDTLI